MKHQSRWILVVCFLTLFLLGINELPVNIRVGSITPQLDDTDKIAISLYGTDSAAGDTAIAANSSGEIPITTSVDLTVTLDSEVVAVDATGQGDVPISTSRDLTVTLDSEAVILDASDGTDIGDVDVASIVTGTNEIGAVHMMGYTGSSWQNLLIEPNTNALAIIDHQDEQVHQGKEYEASGTVDVGNGARFDILIVVSDTIESAMFFEVDSEAECSYILNEDATTSNDGTLVATFNRNRNNANAAATLVYTTPTVSTVGTTIRNRHWGAKKSDGALNRGGWGTILKQSAKYLLRITNETASNNYICWILRWHED